MATKDLVLTSVEGQDSPEYQGTYQVVAALLRLTGCSVTAYINTVSRRMVILFPESRSIEEEAPKFKFDDILFLGTMDDAWMEEYIDFHFMF